MYPNAKHLMMMVSPNLIEEGQDKMQIISLNGKWYLSKTGDNESIRAAVPGCVHTDLLTAGKIGEPFYRNNEEKLSWIGETDWDYKRKFTITGELMAKDNILLRFKGLDTLARITRFQILQNHSRKNV